MATFVEITPDAFNKGFHAVGENAQQNRALARQQGIGGRSYQSHVRRPVRGIQIKDETYSTLQVRTSDGRALPLFDAAGTLYNLDGSEESVGQTLNNSNFIIQSIQEQRVEKQQIVQTFGEPYIFFFGEQPRIISVSGILLNTEDFNWRAEWWANYDQYLRGTACVRTRTRVYLSWDDIIVEGYVMQANAVDESQNRNVIPFQFQMFLTNYENISSIGDAFAHLGFKDIDLNPDAVTMLSKSLTGVSTTAEVRSKNIFASQSLSQGSGQESLLSGLRDSALNFALSGGTGRLLEIDGVVVDFLAEASRFISGRNIRVPIGFEGSSVFDDAQINLASISGAETVITGEQRTVRIDRALAGRNFLIQGKLGRLSAPATYGGLFLNEDEFVERTTKGLTGKTEPPQLESSQLLSPKRAADRVRQVFKDFGVDIEAPSDVRLLVTSGNFGIASVAVGAELNKLTSENGTARFAANLL